MKKFSLFFITIILSMFLVVAAPFNVNAETSPITVTIDGVKQSYEQPPVELNGSTLVPMRGIFEALGATIDWDSKTQSVLATKGEISVVIVINSDYAIVNGKSVKLAARAQLLNETTMVPLRFVSEALGAEVVWNGTTRSITITNQEIEKILSIEEIVNQNDEKIVLIATDTKYGSGIVIKEDLILTNFHVVYDAKEATVTTVNGKEIDVEGIVVYDEAKDLAVIKTASPLNIEPVNIESPKESVKGEKIITIGSPEGLINTVSEGIISGFRPIDNIEYIQITAPITHGSSGGALFNLKGKVIGVTSAGYSEGNLNFAISIDHISEWMEGVLAQNSEQIEAAFLPQTVNEESLSLIDFTDELNTDKYLRIDTDDLTLQLDKYEVEEGDDGELYIFGYINAEQYALYNQNYDAIQEDIDRWTQDMAYVFYTTYPEKDVYFVITYFDLSDQKPTEFESTDYFYSNYEGKWVIDHWLINVEIPAESDEYYFHIQP